MAKYGSQFRGNSQHDALEFLLWLLDRVHEDANASSNNNSNGGGGSTSNNGGNTNNKTKVSAKVRTPSLAALLCRLQYGENKYWRDVAFFSTVAFSGHNLTFSNCSEHPIVKTEKHHWIVRLLGTTQKRHSTRVRQSPTVPTRLGPHSEAA